MEKPEVYNYDVIVVGAGASGIAAAYAAAIEGKKVAIIERASIVGGKATGAYVATICGAYFRSSTDIGKFAFGGWPATFVQRLSELGNTSVEQEKNGIQFLPYDYFDFMRLSENYLDLPNIDLFLQSTVCKAESAEGKITQLEIFVQDRMVSFAANNFIDCSGNALIGDLLGLPLLSSDQYQAGAKVFGVEQIEVADYKLLKLSIYKAIRKGVLDGSLDKNLLHISVVPGSYKKKKLFLKIGLPMPISDRANLLTDLNLEATRLMDEVFLHLKQNVIAFANAHLGYIPSEVGVRTGKRYKGQHILSKYEVLTCVKSEVSIARAVWPIEYWNYKEKPRMEYFAENDYYDIPAECLCNDSITNLYFAGRNISAENEAIASARVIATCLQTGFSSGKLAANSYLLCDEQQKKSIVKNIQESLEII